MNINELQNIIGKSIEENSYSNSDLVKLIELIGGYLNLKTISNYCKSEKISYNGAKKCRNVVKIFDVKFIADNE